MSKNKDTEEGMKALGKILAGSAVAGFFLVKSAAKGVSKFSNWLSKAAKRSEKEVQISNIVDAPFKKCKIKPTQNIDIPILKKKLSLFDKSIYDDLFEPQIRKRGMEYFSEIRMRECKEKGNEYTCLIDGENTYNVYLKFKDKSVNKIEKATCSCPYHKDKGGFCKHIYTLLLVAKCHENLPKIATAIADFSEAISSMITNFNKYIEENQLSLVISANVVSVKKIGEHLKEYNSRLQEYDKAINKYQLNEDELLRVFLILVKDTATVQTEIRNLLYGNSANFVSKQAAKNSKEDGITFTDVAAGLAIADTIGSHLNNKKDKNLEHEMDIYDLEDWQKDLVRQGEYDPWSFEENGELEQDDYYYEDSE